MGTFRVPFKSLPLQSRGSQFKDQHTECNAVAPHMLTGSSACRAQQQAYHRALSTRTSAPVATSSNVLNDLAAPSFPASLYDSPMLHHGRLRAPRLCDYHGFAPHGSRSGGSWECSERLVLHLLLVLCGKSKLLCLR